MFLFIGISAITALLVLVSYCSYLYRVDLRLANLVDNIRLSTTYGKVVELSRKDQNDIRSRIGNRERTLRLLNVTRRHVRALENLSQLHTRRAERRQLRFA